MPRLTWRKVQTDHWLPNAGQTYRLSFGPHKNLASVGVVHRGFSREVAGWMWGCPRNEALGIEHRNTGGFPVATPEEAKQAAEAYIRGCLVRTGLVKGG